MVSFHVKQLTNATESQLEEIADFSAEAFHGDIELKVFMGGDWSLLRKFYIAMLRATMLEGLVYVVTIGKRTDEKIVSIGCWFGNGGSLFATEAQRALGYNAHFEKLSQEAQNWLTKIYPEKINNIHQNFFTPEEIARRWWCYMLATHPQHQGKGYATAIVDIMFKKAKAEGTFIGLATSSKINVKKYLAMGFEHRGGGGPIPAPTGDFFVDYLSKGHLA